MLEGVGMYRTGEEPVGAYSTELNRKVDMPLAISQGIAARLIFVFGFAVDLNFSRTLGWEYILRYGKMFLRRGRDVVCQIAPFIQRNDKGA